MPLRLRQPGPANVAIVTDHHVVAGRACADCQHSGPSGTCFEPVAAALRTEQEGFGIAWPEEGQASGCPVCSTKTLKLAQERPYNLTREQLHAAHAEPWSEAVVVRFQARTATSQRHGYGEQDAENLAKQLHLRDVEGDGMVMCVECSYDRHGRCDNHRAPGLFVPELARVMTVMLQHCAGFQGQPL